MKRSDRVQVACCFSGVMAARGDERSGYESCGNDAYCTIVCVKNVLQAMASQEGTDADGGWTAKLEQLRVDARSRGLEWLRTVVADAVWDEVRKLAQAAGLPVSRAGGARVPVAELREALVKHLTPQAG